MNRPPGPTAGDPHPARHSKSFAHDAIELCELQAALLSADVKQALAAGKIGGVLVLAAGALMFAAAPVLLFALASWIEGYWDLARPLSLLIAGLVGAGVGFIALLTGWQVTRRGAASLGRSREECLRNLAWFKAMLKRDTNDSCE